MKSQNLGENNLSLRADSQNLRGNPPIEKNIDSQGGLPRSPTLARNDDSLLDSADLQNLGEIILIKVFASFYKKEESP